MIFPNLLLTLRHSKDMIGRNLMTMTIESDRDMTHDVN